MTNICFMTSLGEIYVELLDQQAPRTAAHFLAYIDEGYYSGASFYRVVREDNQASDAVRIAVVEGGFSNSYYDYMLREGFAQGLDYDQAQGPHGSRPCISVETTMDTGLAHLDGTLSFGRCGSDEVDDSFFICVGDHPELDFGGQRYPDGLGFSACGRVIAGMEIVRAIHGSPTQGQRLEDEVTIISLHRQA